VVFISRSGPVAIRDSGGGQVTASSLALGRQRPRKKTKNIFTFPPSLNAINRLHIYERFIISLLSDFFKRSADDCAATVDSPRKNDTSYQQNYMQIASAGSP
jgi:hypothetical protein